MQITVRYGERAYGTGYHTNKFEVAFEPYGDNYVGIHFTFPRGQGGRSVNWGIESSVTGARLMLSDEQARKLADELLQFLKGDRETTTLVKFGTRKK